ncbi:MAG TPA: MFS transporter [Candidatus Eisenbacteria bacterium]|nr:MFS transporter [Candidatus Eisenbacteria bacterium]
MARAFCSRFGFDRSRRNGATLWQIAAHRRRPLPSMPVPSSESNFEDHHPVPGRLAALRYRDFRLFWTGLLISNIGTWMQMTATNWLLYELTGSPLQLGLNGIFRAVPAIALGLFSGTFADRFDRRRLLILTQLTLGVLALCLAVLNHSGHIQAWHIYAFTFLSAGVGSFDGPARQALFPSLIPRAVLPNAVALNSLLWKGAALIGPTLGGIAISLAGTSGAFYANALSFLAVVLALMLMRAPPAVARARREFLSEVQRGWAYVASQPIILGVMVMEGVSSVFGLDNAMLTIFASDVFLVGATGFGLLQASRGLGAVVGSSVFLAVGQRPDQGRILSASALLYGLAFALFGLSPSFLIGLGLLVVVGATDAIWSAARSTVLQLITPEGFRGRVIGLFQLSNRGLHPLGQTETGLVVPLIGAREATVLGGLVVSLLTLVTVWRVPGILRFRWSESEAREPGEASSEERAAG